MICRKIFALFVKGILSSLAGKVSDFVGGGCSLVTSINMFKKGY
jgi:hypothetical protein